MKQVTMFLKNSFMITLLMLLICALGKNRVVNGVDTDSITSPVINTEVNTVHEKMIFRSSLFKKERSNPLILHEVVISIRQNNIQLLKDTLSELSTPGNAKYQQWLTSEDIGRLVRNEEATNAVKAWIHSIGATVIAESLHGEYLRVAAPIGTWERELQTEFYVWEDHQKRSRQPNAATWPTVHRCEQYTLPAEIRDHVTAVFNTCQAPPVITHHSQMKTSEGAHPFKSTMYVRQREDTDAGDTTSNSNSNRLPTDAANTAEVNSNSFVHLVNHFTSKTRSPKSPMHTQSAPTEVTVPYLNAFYEVASNQGNTLQNQSVFETDNQYFSTEDLASFQSTFGLDKQLPIDIAGHAIKTCPQVSQCAEGKIVIRNKLYRFKTTNLFISPIHIYVC